MIKVKGNEIVESNFTGRDDNGRYWYRGKEHVGPTNLLGFSGRKKEPSAGKEVKRKVAGRPLKKAAKVIDNEITRQWFKNKKVVKKPTLGLGSTRRKGKTSEQKRRAQTF